MTEVYVIPTGCPIEEQIVGTDAFPSIVKEQYTAYPWKMGNNWTCSGCTVGIGNDETPCPTRKCKIGEGPKDFVY